MRIRWFFLLYAVVEMAVMVALVATIGFGWTVLLLAGVAALWVLSWLFVQLRSLLLMLLFQHLIVQIKCLL